MLAFAPIRFAALATLAVSASLPAQSPSTQQSAPAASTLPATQPTAAPAPAPQIPLTPSQLPAKHAEVTYANGMISVSADNSSLDQILHQISVNTGMKITGGVADERVFGQYGPAAPEEILASLLDGTGSNMILVHRDADASPELILTPRHGGATPPNAAAAAASEDPPEPRDEHPPAAVTLSPQEARPSPGTAPPVTPAASTDTSPASSTQPDSPNGVKTPQQIYEQLQRMRQQQQQQSQPQTQSQPQQQPQQTQPQ